MLQITLTNSIVFTVCEWTRNKLGTKGINNEFPFTKVHL